MSEQNVPDIIPLREAEFLADVGGKALNLGKMLRMGFDVPNGFVVSTTAYRAHAETLDTLSSAIREKVLAAYHAIGSPVVAVRSSATAEDLAGASMAGQYETYLNVQGDEALLGAIIKCWNSVQTDRTAAYLKHQSIKMDEVEMAVVVQIQTAADIAGVLFTVNPHTGNPDECLLEASWGLGEAVVSGDVQPDTLTLDRKTGKVVAFAKGDPKQDNMCIRASQVEKLRRLCDELEEKFGCPQDCEWAFDGDRLQVLQSRNITTLSELTAQWQLKQEILQKMEAERLAGKGPWVRHNLDETLTRPTPLTWSVMQRFMSGRGGFGSLYRTLGFEPSPSMDEKGFLQLWGGRIYMDLSCASEMFFDHFPYRYDLEALHKDPEASQRPPTIPCGPPDALAATQQKLKNVQSGMDAALDHFQAVYEKETRPLFLTWIGELSGMDLRSLSNKALWQHWEMVEKKVMDEFAPASLIPSLLGASVLQKMEMFLSTYYPLDTAVDYTRQLGSLAETDCTLESLDALFELNAHPEKCGSWIERFGHRATNEFELSVPRWREVPEQVLEMAANLKGAERPGELHHHRQAKARILSGQIHQELPREARRSFERLLDQFLTLLPYRENGKDDLMRGYEHLRLTALELSHRLDLGEDLFLLKAEEVSQSLSTGVVPFPLLARRKTLRQTEATLDLPFIIDEGADGLEPEVFETDAAAFSGLAISGGWGRGTAAIRQSPSEPAPEENGYVLVCPSTDPSWTPLFVRAGAIVMERGGTLSHGAVVARELGIPAVVIPGATHVFTEGEYITVDGKAGQVFRSSETGSEDIPNDGTPDLFSPSPVERVFKRRIVSYSLIWIVLLILGAVLPPAFLKDPVFAFWDFCFLSWVPMLQPAGLVAVLAVLVGVVSLVMQKVLTPNGAILEAKRQLTVRKRDWKATHAKGEALPADLEAADKQFRSRTLMASLYPLAMILGILTSLFLWMPERLDPASWNPPPGRGSARILAWVAGDFGEEVELRVGEGAEVTLLSEPAQSIDLIRPPLMRLRSRWQQKSDVDPSLSWELRAAGEAARKNLLGSLNHFLSGPMPARTLNWTLSSREGGGGLQGISLHAEGMDPVTTELVFGHGFPPPAGRTRRADGTLMQVVHPENSPIQKLEIFYLIPMTKTSNVFWPPVEGLTRSWLPAWLLVYLLSYLPVLFLGKRLLRIP